MTKLPQLTPDTIQFILLSFEGPDQYSNAGGLGVRMRELGLELARLGFHTHHVFIGDPKLPPVESPHPNLTIHRWSQWLSARFPQGVYEGEGPKMADWNASLPPFVVNDLVAPAARSGRLTAVLAEEWHTAASVCSLSDQLWAAGLRDSTVILWNANNTIGFDQVDWGRLNFCGQITTVSRYMKHVMWSRGVNPLVIPNGIPSDRIKKVSPSRVRALRQAIGSDELLFKIGRWSPDKRWNMAVDALAEERANGADVSMVIRGGIEPHALEVMHNAHARGLRVVDVRPPRDTNEAIATFAKLPPADIYNVLTFLSDDLISVFYAASDAVLANSGHEPFGLVGLEVMASGGIAFVGSTGEDYAIPYLNAVVLDSEDPHEISIALQYLREHPRVRDHMRHEAMTTARNYSWRNIIEDTLLTKLRYVAVRQDVKTASLRTPGSAADRSGFSAGYSGGYGEAGGSDLQDSREDRPASSGGEERLGNSAGGEHPTAGPASATKPETTS
jgi:glycosyltransferase involved in cell wall biosynthesis